MRFAAGGTTQALHEHQQLNSGVCPLREGQQRTLEHVLEALLHELVRAADQRQAVDVVELRRNLMNPKSPVSQNSFQRLLIDMRQLQLTKRDVESPPRLSLFICLGLKWLTRLPTHGAAFETILEAHTASQVMRLLCTPLLTCVPKSF